MTPLPPPIIVVSLKNVYIHHKYYIPMYEYCEKALQGLFCNLNIKEKTELKLFLPHCKLQIATNSIQCLQ